MARASLLCYAMLVMLASKLVFGAPPDLPTCVLDCAAQQGCEDDSDTLTVDCICQVRPDILTCSRVTCPAQDNREGALMLRDMCEGECPLGTCTRTATTVAPTTVAPTTVAPTDSVTTTTSADETLSSGTTAAQADSTDSPNGGVMSSNPMMAPYIWLAFGSTVLVNIL